MSLMFRAALAVASLSVLGACTTIATPPFDPATPAVAEAPTLPASAEIAAAEIKPAVLPAETVEVSAPTSTPAAPAANETLLYGAQTKWELMSFVEAVRGAGLESALEGTAPVTIFAPNNQAFEFAALGGDTDIAALLGGHIIDGALDMAALTARAGEAGSAKLSTKAGTELTLFVRDDVIKIAGPNGVLGRITQGDMIQSNGVMHQISSVLEAK